MVGSRTGRNMPAKHAEVEASGGSTPPPTAIDEKIMRFGKSIWDRLADLEHRVNILEAEDEDSDNGSGEVPEVLSKETSPAGRQKEGPTE